MWHTNKITRSISPHHVDFEHIDFTLFPPFFDQKVEESNWNKRSKWGYQQMIRFWISRIWDHPAVVENCESVLRIDSDSCFLETTEEGVGLEGLGEGIVYRANKLRKDCGEYTEGLWDLAKSYIYEEVRSFC